MSEPVVTARDLSLQYPDGTIALQDASFDVRRGELVSFVGPSGCGKSTLLRAVAGLVPFTAGALTVSGVAPEEARRRAHSEAFVFQDATLLPWRSVESNVRLPLELLDEVQHGERVAEVLDMVGLTEFATARPAQLSGGMRMRVALARALVTRPDLLLLDEPFGALDELTRQRLNEELLGLWDEHGWTVLSVTHSVFEAVFLSNRVLVMSARPGRIAAEVEIPLAHPRGRDLRTHPDFVALAAEVTKHLLETAE